MQRAKLICIISQFTIRYIVYKSDQYVIVAIALKVSPTINFMNRNKSNKLHSTLYTKLSINYMEPLKIYIDTAVILQNMIFVYKSLTFNIHQVISFSIFLRLPI